MLEEYPNRERRAVGGNFDRRANPRPYPETTPALIKDRRDAEFFDVIRSSLAIKTAEQFRAWTQGDLQRIFPHGMMISVIGMIENVGARIQQIINCNFPPEYIQSLQLSCGLTTSPIIAQWNSTKRPVLFEMAEQHTKSEWLENFVRFGLQNMAAHGQCDLHSRTTSYFTFCKIPGKLTPRHEDLLDMLVPHLHAALTRALNGDKHESLTAKTMLPVFTQREHEILEWLSAGKTNWEIAQVLGISDNTVKHHVQHILTKLNASTRAQAVAKVLFTE